MKKIISLVIAILIMLSICAPCAIAEQRITVVENPKENKYFDGGYILVDIQLDNITDLRTYQGSGTFSELVAQAQTHEEGKIILAINGDYWNYKPQERLIVRNGELLSTLEYQSNRDYCVIYKAGVMKTYSYDIDDPESLTNCWQLFCFGPQLVNNYEPILNYNQIFDYDIAWNSHPRTAIGYYERNHFCFLIVYGRNAEDHGCYLEDMAQFFADLGCKYAYNLDGGSSSHIWYDGQEIGKPSADKPLSDIIYIREK